MLKLRHVPGHSSCTVVPSQMDIISLTGTLHEQLPAQSNESIHQPIMVTKAPQQSADSTIEITPMG